MRTSATALPTVADLSPPSPSVAVTGRNCEVGEHFRRHAVDKLVKIGKFDAKATRVEVELSHESNPRLADVAARVELTVHSRGPVVRAEAAAPNPDVALDLAWQKLQLRLRRQHRRRVGRAGARPAATTDTVPLPVVDDTPPFEQADIQASAAIEEKHLDGWLDGALADGIAADGPFLLREKTHRATPMSLDQALYEMELVGHDFFLFVDAQNRRPCALYRRRGYSYGLLRLDVHDAEPEQG